MLRTLSPRRISVASSLLLTFCLGLTGCGHSSNVKTQSAGQAQAPGAGPVLIAAGTDFYGRLAQPINSKTSKDGDAFELKQTDTMFHKDPALHGSVIGGHLENVQAAGFSRKPGMTIVFDGITMPDGTKAPINVQLISMKSFGAKSHHLRTIGLMVSGAVAGHMMKGHTGKGGAMLGAAGGYALSQTMKTDINVPAGTVLQVRFKAPVTAGSASGQ